MFRFGMLSILVQIHSAGNQYTCVLLAAPSCLGCPAQDSLKLGFEMHMGDLRSSNFLGLEDEFEVLLGGEELIKN